jgi:hypothetical protein
MPLMARRHSKMAKTDGGTEEIGENIYRPFSASRKKTRQWQRALSDVDSEGRPPAPSPSRDSPKFEISLLPS